MNRQITLPPAEQERRRKVMQDALTNARLESLEPDPIFFAYVERYVCGEMTLAEAIADYTKRVFTAVQAK